MLARLATALGATALVAVSLPAFADAAAHAAAPEARDCSKVLRTSAARTSGEAQPHVIRKDLDSGLWNVLVFDLVPGGATTDVTSCLFHDRNRNGRKDRREVVLTQRTTQTLEADYRFGRSVHNFELVGVAQDEQVCNQRRLRTTPLAGGAAVTQTTELTCYRVSWKINGRYEA